MASQILSAQTNQQQLALRQRVFNTLDIAWRNLDQADIGQALEMARRAVSELERLQLLEGGAA